MSLSPPSLDWMVLQCGSCGTRMKVNRGVAATSQLLCPKCRTPVPSEDGEEPAAPAFPPAPEPPAAAPSTTPSSTPSTPAWPQDSGQSPSPSLPTGNAAWSQEFRADPLPERAPAPPPASRSALPKREETVLQGRSFEDTRRNFPDPTTAAAAHPEFEGGLPAETDDDFPEDESGPRQLHPEARRRVKIKKRRTKRPQARYVELTDWDQSELSGIPEAEIAADIWADAKPLPEDVSPNEEANEYLVESVDDDSGQTRTTKKKVRRRRLLLGARLFFTRFMALSRYMGAALALLVAGAGIYGFYVFFQKYNASPLPSVVETPIDRAVLTSYDSQGAEKAVRDFLAADGIEAKLAFVRQPQRIRPLMQKWYRGERTAGPLQVGEPLRQDKRAGEEGTGTYYVILAMPVQVPDPLNPGSTYEETTFFAVEEIREGPVSRYLVDWETSTGYQEMPLETFKSTMPPEAWPFRVYMKAADYYNHGFNELEWQCVQLYYPGRDFQLFGYINRSSLEGRKMLPLVENNRSAGIIAELKYPNDPASREQVIVQRMIHSSWFYAKPEDAALPGDPPLPPSPQDSSK
ncbi:MAG: hypothetical protein JWL81_1712 [Verrucomicrobiales bacterium]|nr:hypothetical protein [Verrucomicrobiales bacterium]